MGNLTLIELRTRLQAVKGKWRQIAELGGIPYSTVVKIAQRDPDKQNPTIRSLEAIDRGLHLFAAQATGDRITPPGTPQ